MTDRQNDFIRLVFGQATSGTFVIFQTIQDGRPDKIIPLKFNGDPDDFHERFRGMERD